MLCHLKHQNWNPDMIYFDNETIDLTPSYHTQRMFSKYAGDILVDSQLSINSDGITAESFKDIAKRVAATVVVDSKTSKRYLKVVNVLPVELKLDINARDMNEEASYEGFNGLPNQERIEIVSGTKKSISAEKMTLVLPPYSLQVIEI